LFALRVLDAHDEHVLGHPAFVTGNVGGDAQREALLAEQGIAAVARTIGPDLARLREVNDILFLVAGPSDIYFAGSERGAHAMDAGNHSFFALIDFFEHALADARHDAHADDHVGGIGQLHTDLGHGAADGAHAVREHVHSAALHAAAKQLLELLAHFKGVDPIIGGASAVLGEGTDKGAVLDPSDIAGVGTGIVAARPEILVELDESATFDHLAAKVVVFVLGTIDPMDGSGPGQGGHLVNPIEK